jgi:hypothetical protein
MQTLTIHVESPQAIRLLEDLEALNLIRVVSRSSKSVSEKISEKFYGSISDDHAEKMREELTQARNEWDRAI